MTDYVVWGKGKKTTFFIIICEITRIVLGKIVENYCTDISTDLSNQTRLTGYKKWRRNSDTFYWRRN